MGEEEGDLEVLWQQLSKRVEEEDVRKEEVKKEEEEARLKKKNRERTYHMCFECRRGLYIVD